MVEETLHTRFLAAAAGSESQFGGKDGKQGEPRAEHPATRKVYTALSRGIYYTGFGETTSDEGPTGLPTLLVP